MPSLSHNKAKDYLPLARKAMTFLDSSPDPFHVVQTSVKMLTDVGFEELNTCEPYKGKLKPGGKYYFTKNKSTLVAFAVGKKYKAGNGFKIIGGHTDTPNLKVKPRSKKSSSGCIQLAAECYGGGLWHTWFDRDLGICGRVLVQKNDGVIEQRLIKINRALVRIPNLCIHLQTAEERKAFSINKEDHLVPILATEVISQLGIDKSQIEKKEENKDGWTEHQESLLLELVASEINTEVENIVDFELNLFDIQPASLGGIYSEFIHSSRMDNHATCFMATQGLIEYVEEKNDFEMDEDISLIVLFDHEEIGSSSAIGAGSPVMSEAVNRISSAFVENESIDNSAAVLARSFVLSVDQAHAIHPNYASKHEKGHAPKMNEGMVIKRNSNQRYATNSVTGLMMREIAKRANLKPLQEFVVRNDCGCGSTIGPIISTATGIRAVDMGCPSLSMHSIRETMGVSDLTNGLQLFQAFFKYFREVDCKIES